MPITKNDLDWFAARLSIAVYDTNAEFRRMTIADQLKAARAQMAEARQSAAKAVAETADASDLVKQEVSKVLKEAADLRAELAGLTNGGPPLDEVAVTPLPPAPVLAPQGDASGEVARPTAGGANIPGVTTY